jgi:lysyl-tRNA synthetase class 2
VAIPYRFDKDASTKEIATRFGSLADGENSGVTVTVAGRVMLNRPQGKLSFATLRDETGEIQLFAQAARAQDFDGLALSLIHI